MTGIRKEYPVEFLLQYINEYYSYSEDLKGLVYKKSNAARNKYRIGQRIGNKHTIYGYVSVRINGKFYREHHLIFLLFNGRLAKEEIDHINGTSDDNRISNLRECTRSQNCANRKRWEVERPFRGVSRSRSKKKWLASIRVNKKVIEIGNFNTPQEAARAYDIKAIEKFGEFAKLNFDKGNYSETC